jgi:hypothetical protein
VRGIAPEAVMVIAETVTAVFGKHSNDALLCVSVCVCVRSLRLALGYSIVGL